MDCDGGRLPAPDVTDSRLWEFCGPVEQERLSSRFVESHFELVRDAILDAADAQGARQSPEVSPQWMVGKSLWSAWVRFRDRALREMGRAGELTAAR